MCSARGGHKPDFQPFLPIYFVHRSNHYLGGMNERCVALIVDQIRVYRVQAHELFDNGVVTKSTQNRQNCVTVFVSSINAAF